MKKVFIISLMVPAFLLMSVPTFAQEDQQTQTEIVLPTQGLSATAAAAAAEDTVAADYVLPYPGLLPDSPFYFLKAFRDHLIGFLISDPIKQSEFDLLQADKRLQAGLYLYQKHNGKEQLALSTFDKGENYFEQSIVKLKEAKRQGMSNEDLVKKLYASSQKHEFVYKTLQKTAPKKYLPALKNLQQRAEKYEKQVAPMVPKPQQ